jgi:ABC-type polysaccharide/polyol phosphate export permease
MICSVLLGQGLGMIASVIQVRIRDLKQVIDLIVRAGFFLSGVFFGAEIIPPEHLDLYFMNPVAVFIELARSAILGDFGVLTKVAIIRSILITIAIYLFGSSIFMKYERKAVKFL